MAMLDQFNKVVTDFAEHADFIVIYTDPDHN